MNAVDQARALVTRAIERRTFPAAAVDVGSSTGSLWSEAFGQLSFASLSHSTDSIPLATLSTLFDLASITKVFATTTVVMQLVRVGSIGLDERVADSFPEWRGADREIVTVQDLLNSNTRSVRRHSLVRRARIRSIRISGSSCSPCWRSDERVCRSMRSSPRSDPALRRPNQISRTA
jgi:hypothetical protein